MYILNVDNTWSENIYQLLTYQFINNLGLCCISHFFFFLFQFDTLVAGQPVLKTNLPPCPSCLNRKHIISDFGLDYFVQLIAIKPLRPQLVYVCHRVKSHRSCHLLISSERWNVALGLSGCELKLESWPVSKNQRRGCRAATVSGGSTTDKENFLPFVLLLARSERFATPWCNFLSLSV